ncbi:hypothetical protein AB0B39_11195 [Micromonospora sp. NPDC049114]|uniref:hypothetical protein n=1 Tax=Micromonospora sp. NPDC049114 TaxID=3155498 RepID=UPI003407BD31
MKEVIMAGPDDRLIVSEFLDRFLGFEDGVITGISIVLPRGDREGRQIELQIQALDRTSPGQDGPHGPLFGWKLVHIRMRGVREYSLSETIQYPLQVLSDGLKVGLLDDRFLLDLEPGPDDCSPATIRDASISGPRQYVIADHFSFEVSDGPFI